MRNDTEHEIVDCPKLAKGKLHRFNNAAGVAYSAIYLHGDEIFSCERAQEAKMISYFNSMVKEGSI